MCIRDRAYAAPTFFSFKTFLIPLAQTSISRKKKAQTQMGNDSLKKKSAKNGADCYLSLIHISFIGAKLATLEWLRERCGENMHRLYFNYRSPKYLLDVFNI